MKPTTVEDFQQYCERNGLPLAIEEDGTYVSYITAITWQVWQAAHTRYYKQLMLAHGAIHAMRSSVNNTAGVALGEKTE